MDRALGWDSAHLNFVPGSARWMVMSSSVCLAPYSHLQTADVISEINQRKPGLGCSLPSDCVLSSYSEVLFADEGS